MTMKQTIRNTVIVKPFEEAHPLVRHNLLLSPVKEQQEEQKFESTSRASRSLTEFEIKAQTN